MGTRENEICDAQVGGVQLEETNEGPIWYLEIIDGKDSGSERNVPFADLVLGIGFLEQRVIGRDPSEPLFPELIPQGPGKRRSAAFTDRFAYYRKAAKVYQPRVDFHSFRGNVETDLKNLPSTNQAWIDELMGHESTIRRSERERYTKQINLPILQKLVNSIRINADLSHLRYAGVAGVMAPNRDHELARFVALAEREMKKKQNPLTNDHLTQIWHVVLTISRNKPYANSRLSRYRRYSATLGFWTTTPTRFGKRSYGGGTSPGPR